VREGKQDIHYHSTKKGQHVKQFELRVSEFMDEIAFELTHLVVEFARFDRRY
jgi:hypothetical protein